MHKVSFRKAVADGVTVFYREAGSPETPKLLLHGFPSASHMFRDLIPLLAERFHVVAPDLPGFGMSDRPAREKFPYTFENVAKVIDRFTEVVEFSRFALYVFDYGAPTGFRHALRRNRRGDPRLPRSRARALSKAGAAGPGPACSGLALARKLLA